MREVVAPLLGLNAQVSQIPKGQTSHFFGGWWRENCFRASQTAVSIADIALLPLVRYFSTGWVNSFHFSSFLAGISRLSYRQTQNLFARALQENQAKMFNAKPVG